MSSQISLSVALASPIHRDDIRRVLLAEGANRWRLLAEQDAAPEGSVSSTGPPGVSGDTARPNYMGPSGNRLVRADERGRNPAESRAYRMDAPVRFQKAVSRSKENAAVGRREARRSASWIGNPVR